MKRSILLSLLVIGAAATLLGAGTFAKFTTSGSDSGTLTAASLSIEVKGSGASLAFSGSGGNCPNALLPGNTCSDPAVTVTNKSAIPVTITGVSAWEAGLLETCGDGDSLTTTITTPPTGTLAPGASKTFGVTVTFDATATTDCQGKSATVQVTVAAEGG